MIVYLKHCNSPYCDVFEDNRYWKCNRCKTCMAKNCWIRNNESIRVVLYDALVILHDVKVRMFHNISVLYDTRSL
jgi:hypothetical protein